MTSGAIVYTDRNRGPKLLVHLWQSGVLTRDELASNLGWIWSAAEFPEDTLDRGDWLPMFHAAGYTVDGVLTPRPEAPIRLYRGAPAHLAQRMSWTAEYSVAQKFAARVAMPGAVWTATVEPWRLLCRNMARDESEHVIDPTGMTFERV